MSAKHKILIFIDWYVPAYKAGGPIQSVFSMVGVLAGVHDVYVFTSNTDVDGTVLEVPVNTWLEGELPGKIFYADKKFRSIIKIRKEALSLNAHTVYINGLFSFWYSVIPLLIFRLAPPSRLIVAPRGMLGQGALEIKAQRKKLFLNALKFLKLYRNIIWHVTSENEKADLQNKMGPAENVYLIPNLPRSINAKPKPQRKDELQLFFYSRIAEKKNLLFALEVLAGITDQKINYHIFGPVEDRTYWDRCLKVIQTLPADVKVQYEGEISPGEIEVRFREMQVLFLPTLNENYGHAIVEAMLCGCPVIISDQTPWHGLQAAGAGYDIRLNDKEQFRQAIRYYCKLNDEGFREAYSRTRQYIMEKSDKSVIERQYINLFYDTEN